MTQKNIIAAVTVGFVLLLMQVLAKDNSSNSRTIETKSEAVSRIVVQGSGDVTKQVQDKIDSAGSQIEIIFDTTDCEMFGLVIRDKQFVKISSVGETTISLPAGKYQQTDKTANAIRMLDCQTVVSDARLTFDGSQAEFYRPEGDITRSGFCWHIEGKGRLVEISNVNNVDNGFGGIFIRSSSVDRFGYDKIKVSDLRSENSPLNIIEVRGGHRSVRIQGIHAEDPNLKSMHPGTPSDMTVKVTAEVPRPEHYIESVIISDIYSRYGSSGVIVQQACRNQLIKDVLLVDRGYDKDGNDPKVKTNGGPSSKIDNVLWFGPSSARYLRYRTVNTNPNRGLLSLWIGQAADQNITVTDCDFDADVKFTGGGNPDRPGREGWSRLGVIRNSILRGRVSGGGHGRIENCRFIGPTVIDPKVPTSQHDDFEQSFGPTSVGLRLTEQLQVVDCDFYAKSISLVGDGEHQIDNPKFYAGSEVIADNKFSGKCQINNPLNLLIRGAYNVTKKAGEITVVMPTGKFETSVNERGPGGPIKVKQSN